MIRGKVEKVVEVLVCEWRLEFQNMMVRVEEW